MTPTGYTRAGRPTGPCDNLLRVPERADPAHAQAVRCARRPAPPPDAVPGGKLNMGDDFAHDPTSGPYDLPGPDVGASITFDSSGHPTQIGIDVPGTAQGSDQATIDLTGGHHDPAAPDPGWM